MRITQLFNENQSNESGSRSGSRRAGFEAAQTLAVASQIALLCPSGMDVWMQRELAGEPGPHRSRRGR